MAVAAFIEDEAKKARGTRGFFMFCFSPSPSSSSLSLLPSPVSFLFFSHVSYTFPFLTAFHFGLFWLAVSRFPRLTVSTVFLSVSLSVSFVRVCQWQPLRPLALADTSVANPRSSILLSRTLISYYQHSGNTRPSRRCAWLRYRGNGRQAQRFWR